ncbi:dimeric dihydrodiol dehydrogenase [Achlya hypogyna]|uniref:D-xylose 1-dehydrogenase (NADP(+), D-xylono-1,5-lactone-forming) n=1 Tax=Achlya hypogyna TaxID=1202772 RepID=A0A1V9YPA0_ACHHY|nr:dimeric dihydrodiol dehydrogenase [Achlya hypogyna]
MLSKQQKLRWGILGCGRIANDFVMGLHLVAAARVVACASRSLEAAQAFGRMHDIPTCYESYEALCCDPNVDVIYVGTLHTLHYPHTLLALRHNKHVLVEKPMSMNQREAEEMIALAREKNLFLMEAMWTRFFPAVRQVRALLRDGVLGAVHAVKADMGFAFPANADRIWKRSLGGGGLLDIGIYPLAFVSMVFEGEEPENVHTVGATSADEGVDTYAVVTLQYSKNRFGTIQYSCLADFVEEVVIVGEKGTLRINAPAHVADRITLSLHGQPSQEMHFPHPAPAPSKSSFNFGGSVGFMYEGEAVTQCILNNERECSEYALSESLLLSRVMDSARKSLGVVYEADQPRSSL